MISRPNATNRKNANFNKFGIAIFTTLMACNQAEQKSIESKDSAKAEATLVNN